MMKEANTYSIAVENQDIVIRLNSELVDQDALAKLLDYIELESIRKRSHLTEAQATALAGEIDHDVWESTKQKYVEGQVATDDKPVILDTNILFSALLSSQSSFAKTLLTSDRRFFVCEMVIVELFKHKDRITSLSQLAEKDVVRLFHVLLKRVTLYKEDMIAKANRAAAYALCCDVDETDTPHVALTLELDGLLWTGDKKLKDGLKRKGFDRFFESNE